MANFKRKKTLQEIKPEIDASLKYLKECKKYDTKEGYGHFLVIMNHTAPNTCVCDDRDAVCEYIGSSGIGELYSKMLGSLIVYLDTNKRTTSLGCLCLQRKSRAGSNGFLALCEMSQVFLNVTSVSLDCGLAVAKSGGILLLFQGVETIKSMGTDDDDINDVFECIFLTLYNVIRLCPSTLAYYRDCNAVAFLRGYLQLDNVWQFFSLLILAYVATDSEKKELASAKVGVIVLLAMLHEAVEDGSHIVEVGSLVWFAFDILDAINHLAVNDDVKTAIGSSEGGIPSIIRMLRDDFSPEEQRVAAEALWNLAFIESIRQSEILQDTIPRLKELARSQDKELRGASASALFEIQGGLINEAASLPGTTPSTPPPSYQEAISEPDQSNPNRSVQIMLSYQWDIKERAIEIRDMLLAAGYKVWIDVTHMRGDILEAMAKAVETSDVILYCMTERYKDSKSCRLEAEYAEHVNKKMIPLLLQKKYKPDGWLGILLGKDMYYKFYPEMSGEEVQNSKDELLKAIKEEIPSGDQPDAYLPQSGPMAGVNEVATTNTTPSKQTGKNGAAAPNTTPTKQTAENEAATPSTTPTKQTAEEEAATPSTTPTKQTAENEAATPSTTPTKQTAEEEAATPSTTPTKQTAENEAATPNTTPTKQTAEEEAASPNTTPSKQTAEEEVAAPTATPSKQTAENEAGTPDQNPSEQTSAAGKWSKEQVQQWLKGNELTQLCEKFKDFDGRHLTRMYKKCSKDEDKFEENMMSNYNLDDATCTHFIVNLESSFKE